MATIFLTPIQKQNLLKSAIDGDPNKLYNEIDRLERRIRQLELGIEVSINKINSDTYIKPSL